MSNPVVYNSATDTIYKFGDSKEFVIGRSPNCNVNIPEASISRSHCLITRVPEEEWLILDKSSFKETYVNGDSIPNCGAYIKNGDVITFSALKSWVLVFYENEDLVPRPAKRRRVDLSEPNELIKTNRQLAQVVEELTKKVKDLENKKDRAESVLIASFTDRKQIQADYEDSCAEIDQLVQERNLLLKQVHEQADRNVDSESPKRPSSSCSPSFHSEIESSLMLKTIEVEELRGELSNVKAKLAKSDSLLAQLSSQEETRLNEVVAIVEQEFLCCVCSDILYEPLTLNCRHTICTGCWNEWKKKKKECPSCRTKVKVEVGNFVMDNFIDRVGPVLGEEFVKRRQESKNERAAAKNVPPANSLPSNGRGRARGRRSVARGRLIHPTFHGAVIDLTSRGPDRI